MFSVTKGEGERGEGGGAFSVRKRRKQFCVCVCVLYAGRAFSVGLARENFDGVVEFVVGLTRLALV